MAPASRAVMAGGHTRSAGAHDNHVVVLGLGDIGDGLGAARKLGSPLAHVTGHGGRTGSGSRRVARSGAGSVAGRRAGAQKRSTAETRRSQAADLEQVTSSEFSSHGESFLLPLDCLRQKISGVPSPATPRDAGATLAVIMGAQTSTISAFRGFIFITLCHNPHLIRPVTKCPQNMMEKVTVS